MSRSLRRKIIKRRRRIGPLEVKDCLFYINGRDGIRMSINTIDSYLWTIVFKNYKAEAEYEAMKIKS